MAPLDPEGGLISKNQLRRNISPSRIGLIFFFKSTFGIVYLCVVNRIEHLLMLLLSKK